VATAENAKLQYESGQDVVAFVALTDQGDHKDFRSSDTLWSNKSGYKPDVKPNGLVTGCVITPAVSLTKEAVDVSAGTCYLAGVKTTIVADTDVLVVRPAASPVAPYKKDSITINSGGTIVVVEGTAGTSFSTTRGADGGPPYIPLDSIEIGQVWMSASATAVIASTEIKQVVGTHTERYDYPTWEEKRANVASGTIGNAGIKFNAALPLIHTADNVAFEAKAVYAQYYEPQFTEITKCDAFVPPETSYSVASKQIYQTTLGSSSSTLNQGSFTAYLQDGISDGLIGLKGANLWFRFYQDKDSSTPYVLCQGILGITRTFPSGDQISAACTISSEEAAQDVIG
jgi:hypothetical protein